MQDTLCVETMDMFVKLYGSEAGDFALKTLPFGGLYVAGGIATKVRGSVVGVELALWVPVVDEVVTIVFQILPLMEKQNKFWENMVAKGRLRATLERIPVFIVLHPQVACCNHGVAGIEGRLTCDVTDLVVARSVSWERESSHVAPSATAHPEVVCDRVRLYASLDWTTLLCVHSLHCVSCWVSGGR